MPANWRAFGKPRLEPLLGAVKELAPRKKDLRADVLAGLPGAIAGVPDGMAASVLAGVSPVHGLYASFAGPIGGGLSTSTKLMKVTTTSAAALAAGSALTSVAPAHRPDALFLLTVLAGALMVVAGALHLGRYTRFVPHSVMIGFLSGISLNILFGQIPDILGYDAQGSFALAKAVDALTHLSADEIPSLLTGLLAVVLVVLSARLRFASLGALLALIVPTVLVALIGADSVARVSAAGEIPQGLPIPQLPHLSDFTFGVLTGALAVAAIVLVQGAGVAEAAPNPDRSHANPNRDFIGQGVGNLLSGLFQGQPVGGSVGQTAVNVSSGARSRWASIFSGLWMILILVLFAGLVGKVAMPTLAGVLMVAAVGSLRVQQASTVWRTGTISKVGMLTTFLATLFLPVAAAVGIGVAVSLLLQLNQEALDLRVVSLVPTAAGQFEEHPAPVSLPSRQVTVIDIYGSLYYAGARTLQSRLPDPSFAELAVVVLRLRGRAMVGSTFVVVIEDYLSRLREGGGRLFLTGVNETLLAQLSQFERFAADDLHIVPADEVLGLSTHRAYDEANEWLAAQQPRP